MWEDQVGQGLQLPDQQLHGPGWRFAMAKRTMRVAGFVLAIGAGCWAFGGVGAPCPDPLEPRPGDDAIGKIARGGPVADSARPAEGDAGKLKPGGPLEFASAEIDPSVFFQQVVDRYRDLDTYRDRARLVQVMQRDGQESSRVETEIGCEIRDGALHVQTPQSQVAAALGLRLPVRPNPALEAAGPRYDFWLAPHMALKFAGEPLKELRPGVDEGFTATEAEAVTIDDRKMVHIELRSGDGLSEACTAKLNLFVNADTMLVERIEGEQLLPDGANYSTTLHITPELVNGAAPERQRLEPAA